MRTPVDRFQKVIEMKLLKIRDVHKHVASANHLDIIGDRVLTPLFNPWIQTADPQLLRISFKDDFRIMYIA